MKSKRKNEIQKKLASVEAFLTMQSALLPREDTLSWAGDCIRSYLEGREKSLDEAFGLQEKKEEASHPVMPSGKQDDWVATALRLIISKTPEGKEWPSTKDLADIGRFCGLGGKNDKNTDDAAIASELKHILAQYDSIAIEQLSHKVKITEILSKTEE